MTYHDFKAKLAEGEAYAKEQDAIYSSKFNIRPSTPEEDRRGIDRHFKAKACPFEFTMQYKGDERAATSGNLFIEIISVDTTMAPGWAIKCEADYMSIYVPQERHVYLLHVRMLHIWVPAWLMRWPVTQAQNKHYKTHGILIPRKAIAKEPPCMWSHEVGTVAGPQLNLAWQ